MKWRVDSQKRQAMTSEGYLMTWAEHGKGGMFYNAYAPSAGQQQHRKHIEASFDREKCKQACEAHLAQQVKAA